MPLALAAIDLLMVYAALALAYGIRYRLKIGPHIQAFVPFSEYQPVAFILLGTMAVVLLFKDAYRPKLSREMVDEIVMVISAATISIAVVIIYTALSHNFEYSRGV